MTISRRSFLATTGLAITGAALAVPPMIFGKDEVPTLLDHILLGCDDLDKGIAFVEEKTGVRAAFGGVHPGRGTRNALLSLGERHYLEIIAPDPAQPNATEFLSLVLKKLTAPRLVGWAAHPGDLDAFARKLRDAGLAFGGPRPGSRQRPDGRTLSWKTLTLADDKQGVLPFFIEWSADSIHPSADAPAGCRIARFEISGPDSGELHRLCKLLDLDVPVGQSDRLQLSARIAGHGGKEMEVTS
jgi:catechol 2,3-dioxygenase-like lactoylglutathione lyase family enzyme